MILFDINSDRGKSYGKMTKESPKNNLSFSYEFEKLLHEWITDEIPT